MIQVYKQEVLDGIEHAVSSKASVAYDNPIMIDVAQVGFKELGDQIFTKAAEQQHIDRSDLYPLYSVLVSVAWNKNDDIFIPEQAWAARNSPLHKPGNLNHVQTDIIGHTISSIPVDKDFNILPDNTDASNLPDIFHIVTGDVIYRFWEDSNRQAQIDRLIAEITKGEWFVSMECIFRGFDYGLISKAGESKILTRNEATAGLTKHLRAYGGTGQYNEYKIGRVLRDITFSGKGYVRNPANPQSVILENINPFTSPIIVAGYKDLSTSSNMENSKYMSTEIETLKAAMDEKDKEMKSKEDCVASLTKEVAELKASLAATKKEKEEMSKEWDNEKAELKSKVDTLSKANDAYEAAVKEYKAAEKKKSRAEKAAKAFNGKAGLDVFVDNCLAMSDEQFDAVVASLATLVKADDMDDEGTADEDSASAGKKIVNAPDPEDILTTAKTSASANLGVSNSDHNNTLGTQVAAWYKTKKGA